MTASAPHLNAVIETSCQKDVPVRRMRRNIADPIGVAHKRLQSLLSLNIADEAVQVLPSTD